MTDNVSLYHGDSVEILNSIECGSVDAIITDPPYNIARKNNFHTMGRQGIDFGEWDKGFDLFGYMDHIPRVLNENGSVVIFNDWKNIGDIARYAESLGLFVKDMIRWEKSNPMPRNKDRRYVTDYECAIWATMPNAKWVFNRQSETYDRPLIKSSLTPKSEKVGHTTQKPVSVMTDLILRHTNENQIVVDPFMGSGTTGVACVNTNRKFIGIELDDNYFEIARKRINKQIDLTNTTTLI